MVEEKINFNEVVMSDEKFFRLDGPDNWFSYSSKDNKFPNRNLRQQGGGGLMVHYTALSNGEFMINYLSRNFNSYNYINLMKESVAPFIEKHHIKDFIWHHDGASVSDQR